MFKRKSVTFLIFSLALFMLSPIIQDTNAEASSVTGKWARFRQSDGVLQTNFPYYITVSGNRFEAHLVQAVSGFPSFEGTVNGSTLEGIAICDYTHWPENGGKVWRQPMRGTLSHDGNTLTFRFDYIERTYHNSLQNFQGWETYPIEWELRRIG